MKSLGVKLFMNNILKPIQAFGNLHLSDIFSLVDNIQVKTFIILESSLMNRNNNIKNLRT